VRSEEVLPAVRADVELLHAAIEGSCGFDSMTVIEIITSRSPSDLASIMKIYKERYDQRLEQVLERRLEDIDLFLLDILAEACSRDVRAQPIAEPAEAPTGIRAELYKFNFYSGPSGKFKAHVETPRSETQIGSLVVCLLSEFEGGILSVSHQGNTVEFDWSASPSTDQTPCIQWAAFYSGCCHEVQEVTAGHRVTLTYKLYASRGSGLLAGKNHSMNATRLPIYRPLVNLLRSQAFMNEGGLMAIGLAHTYPYTHALLHWNMPAALRGVDMMLYEVLLALNLRAEFIRVMDLSGECAEIRTNDRANDYDPCGSEDSDDEIVAVPRDEDTFYRLGFEAMEISDNMIEKSDLRDGMPGWNRLGPVKWIRHPQDSQLEIAHLAVSSIRWLMCTG
jgi:hypothetical protein